LKTIVLSALPTELLDFRQDWTRTNDHWITIPK